MENLILMIDQFVDKSRKLKVNLENIGYRVIIIQNLDEAFFMLNSNTINLIIIFDIGLELQSLKSNKASFDIGILAILDEADKLGLNEKLEFIDDYMFTPYDKEQLYLKIKNLVKINELKLLVAQKNEEIQKAYEQLNNFGLIDKVTGLYNSFYFSHMLQNQCASAKRYGYKLSGVMISIDNKIEDVSKYNEIAKEIANILTNNVRTNDVLVRLNQQEFYVLLPHTSLKDALFVAEKLRENVLRHNFNYSGKITISAGVSTLGQLDKGIPKEEELVSNAREALKKAVSEGGNISSVIN